MPSWRIGPQEQIVREVRIRHLLRRAVLGDDRVVIHDHARRVAELQRNRRVVDDVADVVRGPPKIGCALSAGVRRVHSAVPHHADVVDAAIGFDEVVAGHVDVVVVDVDRDGPELPLRFRHAVRADADPIMEEGHGVMRDHMA